MIRAEDAFVSIADNSRENVLPASLQLIGTKSLFDPGSPLVGNL
jgi:hypothetical protein